MCNAKIHPKQKVSRFRYLLIIMASVLIMLCSGSVYAWSIFVAPLQSEFGFTNTQTQIVYGLIIGVFTLGMLFVNKVMRKYGPRISAIIGAVLFFAGYMVSSISQGNILLLILGMSVLSGIGMAFGYVTVLNNLIRWLPSHKGLATGLAVSGFGAGAILLSQIARPLLASGWQVLDIFRIVGVIYGVLFLFSAFLLSSPAWFQPKIEEAKVEVGKLLKDKRFWIVYYVFFAGTFAGLLFNGNLKPIGQSYGVSAGATVLAISLFSIGNAAGRIIWGQIHDILGGRKTILTSLSLFAVSVLLVPVASRYDHSFVLLAFILGFNFGSNFVTYASDCCNFWGIAKLDIIYPAVSTAYGIAGILGPIAGGAICDATGNYYAAIVIGSLICFSGMLAYAFLMPQRRTIEQIEKKSAKLVDAGLVH